MIEIQSVDDMHVVLTCEKGRVLLLGECDSVCWKEYNRREISLDMVLSIERTSISPTRPFLRNLTRAKYMRKVGLKAAYKSMLLSSVAIRKRHQAVFTVAGELIAVSGGNRTELICYLDCVIE